MDKVGTPICVRSQQLEMGIIKRIECKWCMIHSKLVNHFLSAFFSRFADTLHCADILWHTLLSGTLCNVAFDSLQSHSVHNAFDSLQSHSMHNAFVSLQFHRVHKAFDSLQSHHVHKAFDYLQSHSVHKAFDSLQ